MDGVSGKLAQTVYDYFPENEWALGRGSSDVAWISDVCCADLAAVPSLETSVSSARLLLKRMTHRADKCVRRKSRIVIERFDHKARMRLIET